MFSEMSGYFCRNPSAAVLHAGRFSTLVQVQTVTLPLVAEPELAPEVG